MTSSSPGRKITDSSHSPQVSPVTKGVAALDYRSRRGGSIQKDTGGIDEEGKSAYQAQPAANHQSGLRSSSSASGLGYQVWLVHNDPGIGTSR